MDTCGIWKITVTKIVQLEEAASRVKNVPNSMSIVCCRCLVINNSAAKIIYQIMQAKSEMQEICDCDNVFSSIALVVFHVSTFLIKIWYFCISISNKLRFTFPHKDTAVISTSCD